MIWMKSPKATSYLEPRSDRVDIKIIGITLGIQREAF